jgi:DNA-binding beta-propeller fold protein YncE
MAVGDSRYDGPAARVAEGWTLQRRTPPSRLNGANGLRTGPDGRIYVAQVAGSAISAIDPDTGAIETVSAVGGAITAPDDLVFDEASGPGFRRADDHPDFFFSITVRVQDSTTSPR